MQKRQRWVIGNWKMNGDLVSAHDLLRALLSELPVTSTQVAVCPPFVHLPQAQTLISAGIGSLKLGAQDVCEHAQGAYTGQISAAMLKEFGARLVLVGHSERRTLNGEDELAVARKAAAALSSGLIPVICVGENLSQREAGQAEAVVSAQLSPCREVLEQSENGNVLIAYEPVWAIGTGKTASPEQAQNMHYFIRQWLSELGGNANKTPVLYGGSVKAANAASLFAQTDIDGALVGGAALDAKEFLAIVTACQ